MTYVETKDIPIRSKGGQIKHLVDWSNQNGREKIAPNGGKRTLLDRVNFTNEHELSACPFKTGKLQPKN